MLHRKNSDGNLFMQRKSELNRLIARQRGLTLVELMIAMVLGVVLMIGVVQLFSNMRESYSLNESMSRVQENSRFAVDLISQPLRMAGYMGCLSMGDGWDIADGNNGDSDAAELTSISPAIRGYEYTSNFSIDTLRPGPAGSRNDWSPSLPNIYYDADEGQPVSGSDAISIRFLGNELNTSQINVSSQGNNIVVDGDPDINEIGQDTPVLVTDCSRRALSAARNDNPGQGAGEGNMTIGLGGVDPPGFTDTVTVGTLESRTYYVGETRDGPALFEFALANGGVTERRELVGGIEAMRIHYGIDTDGNGSVDEYRTASNVSSDQWHENVRSIRIALLVRGDRDVQGIPERTTVNLLGEDIDITAGRFHQRRVITSTIQLRNR